MSSDDNNPPIRHRTRRNRRVLAVTDSPPILDSDPFDPGPMVNYPPLALGPDGHPIPAQLRQRIRDMRALDRKAAREFILRTLHAYLMAHRPMDEIARAFGVGVREVYVWRTELNKRMALEFRRKTPVDLLVEQVAHFQRIKAYAWQQASRATQHVDKWRWVNSAMSADKNIAELYIRVGLIDETTMRPQQVNAEAEDTNGRAATLAELAKHFLEGHVTSKKKGTTGISVEQDITGPTIDDQDFLV